MAQTFRSAAAQGLKNDNKTQLGIIFSEIATELDTFSVVGGSDTNIQFNNAGVLGGSNDLIWDNIAKVLGVSGDINLSGRFIFPLGTAAAPSLYPDTDPNTGIYSPGADTLAASTNGTERFRITSTGLVGIGTNAPSKTLDVVGDAKIVTTSATQNILLGVSSGGIGYKTQVDFGHPTVGARIESERLGANTQSSLSLWTTSSAGVISRALTIDQAQRVGIGTTSPSSLLDVRATSGNVDTYIGVGDASLARIRVGYQGTGFAGTADGGAVTTDSSGSVNLATRSGVANNIAFATSTGTGAAAERARVTSDGYLRLASGTGGIQFNGDTAAANALDDYEEGTWTPTIIGSATAGTATYTAQAGIYTKVGRQVTIMGYLNWSGGTGAGDLRVSGLPVVALAGANYYSAAFGLVDGIALSANNILAGYVSQGVSQVTITQTPAGGGAYATVPYDAAGHFMFSCTYFV